MKQLDVPTIIVSPQAIAAPIAVEFCHVTKTFGHHQVLKEINLQVMVGEVVVICGPSGSGKSTLIRLINQLEKISSGEIFIHQQPTAKLRGRQLRKLRTRIGFVFQQFNLYAHLNALDNIALALIKIQGRTKSIAYQYAREKLRLVGLVNKEHYFPCQLSGGQQQRVAIARALATDANILLFDEPTSALDPEMIGEVLTVMRNLAQCRMTMIIITHEMHFARQIADKIIFMDNGEILEEAKPACFFTHPQHLRTKQFLEKVLYSYDLET